MKIILSSMLALAIAGSPPVTQEPDPKEKPKQEEPKKQSPPKSKQEPDEKSKQEPAPPPKQDEKERQKQQKEQAKRENNRPPQEQNASRDNHKQAGAQSKGRIPPEKFRASFGREHHFRVARRSEDRRFQYGGYWFEVVEVWPARWSFDDDCYIEEDGDDYYLVDVVHPEIRVLVVVVSG